MRRGFVVVSEAETATSSVQHYLEGQRTRKGLASDSALAHPRTDPRTRFALPR